MLVLLTVIGGCGGDDAATATTGAGQTPTDSAKVAPPTGARPPGALPDACSLLSADSVGDAIGAAAKGTVPQPANEVSSRCEWNEGQPHGLSLLVRHGPSAKSSFDNTSDSGFDDIEVPGTDARIQLGALSSGGSSRLVLLSAFDGQYYVSLSLRGPALDDQRATAVASSLTQETYASLRG